ncbi:uncharacterized protein LOC121384175 isoform X2 [Gigantopelta aegis]|nr:uncharacterized protein LOC121384175 isoform X2 [Gigantopelta aegis]
MTSVHCKLLTFSLMVSTAWAIVYEKKVTFYRGRQCSELFYFDYMNNLHESLDRVFYQGYVGDVSINNGKAQFYGRGHLEIAHFNANGFQGTFALAVKFKAAEIFTYKEIGILGNGQRSNTTTFLVSYIKTSLFLKTTVYKYQRAKMITRDINLEIPELHFVLETQIRLAFSDGILMFQANSSPVVAARLETGEHLLPTGNNLSLGRAGGLQAFKGTVDDFIYYTCIPAKFFNKITWP